MTSPTEGSDPVDNTLNNSEEAAVSDRNPDLEPSFVDSSRACQVETNQTDLEPYTTISRENDGAQTSQNSEPDVQKLEKESQKENSEEGSLLIQIPIPRKLVFLMSRLGRILHLSIPTSTTDKNIPLTDRLSFNADEVEVKGKSSHHAIINHRIPFQLSISCRIPFINNNDMRRMILRLLCGRYMSEARSRPYTTWVKQKYVAFLPPPNALTNAERLQILRRPLRVYNHRPLTQRGAGKCYKFGDAEGKNGSSIFIRPVFYVPRAQLRSLFNRKTAEDHLRSHESMLIVIIGTSNGWKYLCPICRNIFNTLVEFRQHSYNLLRN